MGKINEKSERLPTMELNKLSVGIITALITAGSMLGGFCYQNGKMNEKIENLERQAVVCKQDYEKRVLTLKSDFRLEIKEVKEKKADKDVVELILKKIDHNIETQKEINRSNQEQHQKIIEKLDKIYERK